MSNYYIDFEFIEGFHKPLFSKRRHFIDMISVGIVCEDGREYHAVSNEFNPKDANVWVKRNVLDKIELDFYRQESTYAKTYHPDSLTLKNFIKWYGKSNFEIANEIIDFVNFGIEPVINSITKSDCWAEEFYPKEFKYIRGNNTKIPDAWHKTGVDGKGIERNKKLIYNQPKFYGYYSDYDWVLFCSLFGKMMDLPKGFPMYCLDLKQSLDEVVDNMNQLQLSKFVVSSNTGKWTTNEIPKSIIDIKNWSRESKLELLKSQQGYPKQENNHNALADAKWNKQLYDFINSITNV